MPSPPIRVVIMAGGSGTRFWPASRTGRPKQFLPISSAKPMIAETFERVAGLVPPQRIFVVTAASQAAQVRASLPQLPAENILAEPQAKNTAPCVGYAAHEIHQRAGESVMVVLPADHVIEPASAFRRTLAAAAEEAAAEDVLITFGIQPTYPATGYGYVEAGERLHERDSIPVHEVARFVEKPDRARAEEFLATGRFFWNSGMFVWRTSVVLDAYARHCPAVYAGLQDLARGEALEKVYAAFPSAPVDVEILERADNVRLLPIDYRWSDVGSWAALPEVHESDASGNWPVLGADTRLLAEDAHGCVVYAEEPDELIALLGVRDLVVVRSGKTTLICPRERAQDVKRLVERLRAEGPDSL